MTRSRRTRLALVLPVLLSLAACGGGGGGGSTTSTTNATTNAGGTLISLSGVVVDGYLSGATACLDVNGDGICGANEPTATTDNAGFFAFTNVTAAQAAAPILVEIPSTAVDMDTGAAIGKAFKMASPAGSAGAGNVVSPLTTLVHAQQKLHPALSKAGAENVVKSKLGYASGSQVSLFADYVAASQGAGANAADYTRLHNVAKVSAQVLADSYAAVDRYANAPAADVVIAAASMVDSNLTTIVQQADTYAQNAPNGVLTAQDVQAAAQAVTPPDATQAQQLVTGVQLAANTQAQTFVTYMANNNNSFSWFSSDPPLPGAALNSGNYAYGELIFAPQANGALAGFELAYQYDPYAQNNSLAGPIDPYGFRREALPFAHLTLNTTSGQWALLGINNITFTPQADGSFVETQGPLDPNVNPNTAPNWQIKHSMTPVDLSGQNISQVLAAASSLNFFTAGWAAVVDPYAVFSAGALELDISDTPMNDSYRLGYWTQPTAGYTDPISGATYCWQGGAPWVDIYTNCNAAFQYYGVNANGTFVSAMAQNFSDLLVTQDYYGNPWVAGSMSHNPATGHFAKNALGYQVAEAYGDLNPMTGQVLVYIISQVNGLTQAEFYWMTTNWPNQSYTYIGATPVVVRTIGTAATQVWVISAPTAVKSFFNGGREGILAVQNGYVREGSFWPAGATQTHWGEYVVNPTARQDILNAFVQP